MRKSKVLKKHKINPDPVYKDLTVSKFVNHLMRNGKKFVAYKIFYKAIKLIEDKTKGKGLEILMTAIKNTSPSVEIKRRRIGGNTAQIPVEIRKDRADFLAMTWLIKYAKKRAEKRMAVKLANEVVDAYNGEGEAIKKREEIHKMASSNKLFAPMKGK